MKTGLLTITVLGLLNPMGILALDENPHLLRHYFAGAIEIFDIAASGNFVYVAQREFGPDGAVNPGKLQVIDVTNPAEPRPVGNYDTGGTILSVEVSGDYAYARVDNTRLQIIDVEDPTNPQLGGEFVADQYLYDVAVAGDYAYLAVDDAGLLVIDVSDPLNPTQIGDYVPDDRVSVVSVSGDYAAIYVSRVGMEIIDVSDPSNPQRVGSHESNGNYDAIVDGDRVFLMESGTALEVLDISDPTNPTFAGEYSIGGLASEWVVVGQYLYLARAANGLDILDISDPDNIQAAGRFEMDIRQLAVASDLAYVGTGFLSAFAVLDLGEKDQPEVLGRLTGNGVDPQDFVISGDYGYVADGLAGLVVFDLRPSEGPVHLSSTFVGGPAENLAVLDGHALVTSGNRLHVIDIGNPGDPVSVGSYESEGSITDIVAEGSHVYLTEHPRWNGTNDVGGGLRIIDLTDPAQPLLVGSYGDQLWANSVAFRDGYAYIADRDNFERSVEGEGLAIVDVRNPTDPRHIAGHRTMGNPVGVAISENHVFMASKRRYDGAQTFNGGLEVIEVRNPNNPLQVSFHEVEEPWSFSGYTAELLVQDNHLFVVRRVLLSTGNSNVEVNGPFDIFDISDLTDLRWIWRYGEKDGLENDREGPFSVRGLSILGDSIWLAEALLRPIHHGYINHSGGLQEFVINPANPQSIATLGTPNRVEDMTISEGYAFLAVGSSDLQVADISDISLPVLLGTLSVGDIVQEMAVLGNFFYLMTITGNLLVIDMSDPNKIGAICCLQDATAIAVTADQHAYLASMNDGLKIIDISDQMNPREVGNFVPQGNIQDVAVSGNYAYLAGNFEDDFLVIEVADPTHPLQVASIDLEDEGTYEVIVDGSTAFTLGSQGLYVIDISTPPEPELAGVYRSLVRIEGVAVSGNYVYLAVGDDGLRVLDVGNPADPVVVGDNTSFSGAVEVMVANGKVYVATDQGLVILHEYRPLRLAQPNWNGVGTLELKLSGPPGVPGRVQRSSDLKMWSDWLSVDFEEMPTEITDPDAATNPTGFYRLVVP